MDKQLDVKGTFELVTSEKEFLEWLDAVYSLMFEEIGSFTIASEGGKFSERMKAYDDAVDQHMIGMDCLANLRAKLSWKLFEEGDTGSVGLLNPSGRNYRAIERERTIKSAEAAASSSVPKGTFYR